MTCVKNAGSAARNCSTRSSISACRRRARAIVTADQLDGGETFYPLHVRICDELPARAAARRTSRPRRSSPTTPTSPRTPTPGSRTPRRSSRLRSSPWRSEPSRSWSRWPATTATCSSTASRGGSARWGSSRRQTSPRSPVPAWHPDRGRRSSARRRGARSPRSTARPTSSWPTTSSPTCPTSSTSARGLRALVADDGPVSIEIPHLLRLIEGNEYDTIYHEHFSYLSLLTAQRVLAAAGLTRRRRRGAPHPRRLHADAGRCRPSRRPEIQPSVARVLADEAAAGLDTLEGHQGFATAVADVRNDFVEFLDRSASERASAWSATARRARATRC